MRMSLVWMSVLAGLILLSGMTQAWVLLHQPIERRITLSMSTSSLAPLDSNARILQTESTLIDGAEWQSLKPLLMASSSDNVGILTGIVFQIGSERQVALSTGSAIYPDSVANVPSQMSNSQALATVLQGLLVHVALQCGPGIGGSSDKSPGIVIWGASPRAQQLAQACAHCNASVTVVTTDPSKVVNLPKHIQILSPSVGELELPVCSFLESFDVLVDTLENEESGNTVRRLLQQRHGALYMSIQSQAQAVVALEGLLWGPGKASNYLQSRAAPNSRTTDIVVPINYGRTVQSLLDSNIMTVWENVTPKPPYVRKWSLADFWEASLWPRDTSFASIRFGLPSLDVIEDDNYDTSRRMISEAPERGKQIQYEDIQEDDVIDNDTVVVIIEGVSGLQTRIVESKQDCVLFLSAPFCRTCRYLTPQFGRLAQQHSPAAVVFAKADTSGPRGKELGRLLQVEAVPTFLLFRNGQRFGKPLGVTRLPSKKLQAALDLLESGAEWSDAVIRQAEATQ